MNWWERFRRSSAHTQANIICTFVVMVATVAYVWVATRQLRAMNGQLEQMKNSTSQTEAEFKQDQRPYIAQTVKTTSGPIWHDNPLKQGMGQIIWDWHMSNYGKSPAQNIRFTQEMKLTGQPWKPSHGETEPNIGPPQVQGQDVFDTVISDEMPRTEFDRLMQITDAISIRIKINYSNLDGTPFESGLCLSRTNAGSIMYCKSDNYIH